jgi:hypothetical protein
MLYDLLVLNFAAVMLSLELHCWRRGIYVCDPWSEGVEVDGTGPEVLRSIAAWADAAQCGCLRRCGFVGVVVWALRCALS